MLAEEEKEEKNVHNYFSAFIYYLNFVCLFNATMNTNNGNKHPHTNTKHKHTQCEVRNAMSPFSTVGHTITSYGL